ncbi:DUF1048 domain-containing protein [Anaerocolumna sp. MB42-C2]|uniref:DUF1048 domain-containing protein n=1 Tax=Anaerocolumna sp. MB42-C2 TaxID=3070997 RepID=UPI0027DFEB1F|nr:DUF1048 domain-containing protein [Anaerocolumna sp. MB42-C2]WMJ86854.1 DUF1048 domain-containing protein [Anaerocolumna sp. MB42-C2]
MIDRFMKLVIGDLEEKKEYSQMMKRVHALPQEYRFAFKKIQRYMYNIGAINGDTAVFVNFNVFIGLLELFEASAAEGKNVIDITGSDVGRFADELIAAYSTGTETVRDKLNHEVAEYFKKEDK